MKSSNNIQLTTGYPNYYCLEVDVKNLINCNLKSFPLNFKVFTSHLILMTGGIPLKKNSFTAFQLLKDPLNRDYNHFRKAMERTVVFISTKHRLPSRNNCEKAIDGIKDFHFTFGNNQIFQDAYKGKIDKKLKIYFSIQYGHLVDFLDKKENLQYVTKQDR